MTLVRLATFEDVPQLVQMRPRPGKSQDPYNGYVTNVYTCPAMENWSKENEVEIKQVLLNRRNKQYVKT